MHKHPDKAPSESLRKKQRTCEQLWLLYFNNALYARGILSEEQRKRMQTTILLRNRP